VPDHRLALARRGTALVGSVKSAALVEVIQPGSRIAEGAAAVRQFVRARIASSVGRIHPQSAAIVTAILIGDRAGLDDRLERRLQEAGTYHVIAISGGNIAVFAACLFAVGRLVRLSWRRGLLVTAAGLLVYGAIATGGSSVSRAIVMALVYVIASAVDYRSGPASALGIAAGLILCADPLAIVDAGFLLTFGATTAILIGVPPAVAKTGRRGVAAAPVALAAASLSSELALLPIGAFFFSRVTVAGLVLNLLAVPLMSVVQIGGLSTVLLATLHRTAGELGAWVPHLAAQGLVRSASFVEYVPWLMWRVAAPAAWLIAAYYALLVAWIMRDRWIALAVPYHRMCRVLLASGGAGAVLLVIIGPPQFGIRPRLGWLSLTVLDVGQGDSTLVQLPTGEAFLVDAGGLGSHARFDIGERVVAPAVWHLGVPRLTALVLTHGDPDHIGGAPAVLEMLRPREIWEGIPVPSHDPLVRLAQRADGDGITWRSVQAGDELRIGRVTMTVLHPPLPDWERQRVRNDDSVVLDVRLGDVSVLLPGDVGADVERRLASVVRPARVRVLKVAHHGSRTSTSPELVTALRPDLAIVSCGRDNRYGHPVPEVLDRLHAVGATVYRTDVHGAITIDTDGQTIAVRTWRRDDISR
jgi:competence protein ComEC